MSQVPTVKIKSKDGFTIINESDFNSSIHELCEGEKLSNVDQITVTLNAEIAPELQQAIDEAKAECEKVVAENEALKQKIAALDGSLVVANERIAELEAKPKKPTAAELKAAKAAEQPQE